MVFTNPPAGRVASDYVEEEEEPWDYVEEEQEEQQDDKVAPWRRPSSSTASSSTWKSPGTTWKRRRSPETLPRGLFCLPHKAIGKPRPIVKLRR